MNVAAYAGGDFFESPDDAEMGLVTMGEVEPYYPDPLLRGGPAGWPDAPQQNMDPSVVATYAQRLRDIGYDAPITGVARDPGLMQAVAYFQEYKGLLVDGLLGPQTNAAIDREWAALNQAPYEPPQPSPSGPAPYPSAPGDLPIQPIVDPPEESSSIGKWLVGGGLAIALGVGAWYAWGR